MKICIDIRTINKPKSGVGYYVTNLIGKLQQIDHENKYCLISNIQNLENEFKKFPNFKNCYTRISNENHLVGDLWESFYLPGFLRKNSIDVFHGPAFMIPLRSSKVRFVVTIHDIVAYIKPETIPLKYAVYMRRLIKFVVKKADKIIAPSQSTKTDLIDILNVPEEKIEIIYEAVDSSFKPANGKNDQIEIKRKFGIKNKFILFVGNLEPRKNLIRLFNAFEMSKKKLGDEYQMVVCGKKGWLYKDILKAAHKLSQNGDLLLTDYVEDQDLIRLYQAADIFLFPTLYEGFGLPALEAMASGTPVITSKSSSLPEITGDAAYLVDPCDEGEIRDAILKLANSGALREELGKKGIEQAKRFSWTKTAEQTLEVYKSLL